MKKLILPIIMFVGFILTGFCIMNLWNWFISDTFEITKINFWQAMGIDCLVTFITYDATKKYDTSDLTIYKKIIVLPLVYLTLGFVFRLFV